MQWIKLSPEEDRRVKKNKRPLEIQLFTRRQTDSAIQAAAAVAAFAAVAKLQVYSKSEQQ